MDKIRRIGKALVGLSEIRVNIEELQTHINNRRDLMKEKDFRDITDFIRDERIYVIKLKSLKDSRKIIAAYESPEIDLFGSLNSITELHEHTIPSLLAVCRNVEGILELFANHIDVFQIYIQDQWAKSRNQFERKQALNTLNINDLDLPERRVKEYLNFLHQLKNTSEHVKDSELLSKSIQSLKNLFLQMQYAKELASVEALPPSVETFVHLADNFQVKFDNSRFIPYRIYFCTNHLYLVSEMMRFDFDINVREISLNQMEDDQLLFALTIMPRNNICVFKSTTPDIKNEWTKLLRDILYAQVEEEKLKIKTTGKVKFAC